MIITEMQMDYLNAQGVDIREPLERDDIQGVLDTIDDEIVDLLQDALYTDFRLWETVESMRLRDIISRLQRIYDQISAANWPDDE